MVKSDVWMFFKEPTPKTAVCSLCLKQNLSKEKSTVNRNDNTSHLWRHLDDFHSTDHVCKIYFLIILNNNFCSKAYKNYKEITNNTQKEKQKVMQTTLNIVNNVIGSARVYKQPSDDEINEKIADFIVSDCQAYSVVEDDGFIALIKLAFPKYKMPGREFFKSYITKLYEKYLDIRQIIIFLTNIYFFSEK